MEVHLNTLQLYPGAQRIIRAANSDSAHQMTGNG